MNKQAGIRNELSKKVTMVIKYKRRVRQDEEIAGANCQEKNEDSKKSFFPSLLMCEPSLLFLILDIFMGRKFVSQFFIFSIFMGTRRQ